MNKAGGIRLPDISLYYTATVIKTVWYWPKKKKKKPDTQINGTEQRGHKKNPCTYGQTIYEKGDKNIQQRKNIQQEKRQSLQQLVLGKLDSYM